MNTNSTAHGTARPARRRRRPFPSALWIAADTLLVIGVAGGLWLGYANRVPNVTVPEPEALPVNGYDRLREAAAKIVRREDVDAAVVAWDSPDLVGQRNATPAQRETLVAENAATLAALRGAMAMPVRVTPLRTTDQLFPELADIRGAARLIRLDGDVHAARGENAQAAASYLDAMELGNDLMPDSWMIPRLVGIACEAIGRRPLVSLADALSADEARAAAAIASSRAARLSRTPSSRRSGGRSASCSTSSARGASTTSPRGRCACCYRAARLLNPTCPCARWCSPAPSR